MLSTFISQLWVPGGFTFEVQGKQVAILSTQSVIPYENQLIKVKAIFVECAIEIRTTCSPLEVLRLQTRFY